MNLKQAKKLRKLVYGEAGQGTTEYETVNDARGVRMTIEGPEKCDSEEAFFSYTRQKAYDTIFCPAGTVQCIGPRRIYQIMKAKGVTK
jgi:hypothetical protein